MEYAWKRYRMDKIEIDQGNAAFVEAAAVDNPGNQLAYGQAQFLVSVAKLIPVPTLREKIAGTGRALLEDKDAVVLSRDTNR